MFFFFKFFNPLIKLLKPPSIFLDLVLLFFGLFMFFFGIYLVFLYLFGIFLVFLEYLKFTSNFLGFISITWFFFIFFGIYLVFSWCFFSISMHFVIILYAASHTCPTIAQTCNFFPSLGYSSLLNQSK